MLLKVTASSASPAASPRGLQIKIIDLMKQTHGLIFGATRYLRIEAMRFLF